MTRINVGVLPLELSDKHLLAEHREIKRIPNNIRVGRYRMEGVPLKFTLGKGHVKFFYNKLRFLKNRYEALYAECIRRGFKVTYYGDSWRKIPRYLMQDYTATQHDRQLILERIKSKE